MAVEESVAMLEAALGIDLPTAHKTVISMAWKVTNGNREESEDLTQQVFKTLMEKALAGTLAVRSNPIAMLRQMTANKFKDHLRAEHADVRGGKYTHVPLDESIDSPLDDWGPEEQVLRSEDRDRVIRAMQGLSSEQQQILYFLFVEEMPKSQVAERMGYAAQSTFRDAVSRTYGDLRNLLRRDGGLV